MTRSTLVYLDLLPVGRAPTVTVVALHAHGGTAEELAPLCHEIHPSLHIVAPQAARPVNAPERVYSPVNEGGFRWCFTDPDEPVEPATFGESVWRIEQFVYDVKDRIGATVRPIVLLGRGQGALVALTIATVIPDLLAGVVAIDGVLPVIPGWSSPAKTLGGLPILLISDPLTADQAEVERTRSQLDGMAAKVTAQSLSNVSQKVLAASVPIRDWLEDAVSPLK